MHSSAEHLGMRAGFALLGLVLAACGESGAKNLGEAPARSQRSALIWNPVDNQMRAARFQHAAASLGPGHVLLCGGRSLNPSAYYTDCEVYSASNNTFQDTQELAPARAFFTLTAIAPDRVIAVGGFQISGSSTQYLDDAWRYDWVGNAGNWTSLGSIGTGRRAHAAGWLPGPGRLLVSGGVTVAEATLPDDVQGNGTDWAPLTSGSQRVEHTLTVLESGDRALVAAGRAATNELGTVKLFSPSATGSPWSDLGPVLPRYGHTATLLPNGGLGLVLFAGGYADPVNFSATTSLYDPSGAGSAANVKPLVPGRAYHAAALLHGKVIVTGGLSDDGALRWVDVYDPELDVWYDLDPMEAGRYDHTLTVLDDDRLLVAGGRDLIGALSSGEVLQPLLPGETCDPERRECLSGHCVDGVCCLSECDQSCHRCDGQGVCQSDVTGAPQGERAACANGYLCGDGACLTTCSTDEQCDGAGYFCDGRQCVPKQESGSCSRDEECVAGLPCIDGFCCNSSCDSQCEACNKPEHEGTCTAIDGPPRGDRASCTGGGGDCGLTCDGTDRVACHFPKAGASCSQERCVGALQEHPGMCNGRGSCSDTPMPCGGGFVCDAAATACANHCTDDESCAVGYFCKDEVCAKRDGLGASCEADGGCEDGLVCEDSVCCAEHCEADSSCNLDPGLCKKELGADCLVDDQCGSGVCADRVCCEDACAGQCEACNLTGHVGSCRPVVGEPMSPRPICDTGDGACSAKTCDGRDDHRDSCEGWLNLSQICAEPQCQGGRFSPGQSCGADGECGGGEPIACHPYACAAEGCLERCDTATDCAADRICVGNQCVPPGPHCVGGHLLDDGFGKQIDCQAYRCAAGACLKQCSSSSDCVSAYACDGSGQCRSDALGGAASSDGGCGCAIPGSQRGEPRGLLLAGFLWVLCWRRKVQRASSSTRWSSASSPANSEALGTSRH